MRHPRRRAVAIVTALIGTLTALAPADGASAAVPWTMAPCATAQLAETGADTNGGWLVISGAAVQCAPAAAGGGVRLAVYPAGGSTGTAHGYNVRLFPSAEPGAVRAFGAAVGRPVAGEFGVCVLAGDNVRIDCVRVTVTRPAPPRLSVATAPLDPGDPLVAKPVDAFAYNGSVVPPVSGDPSSGVCGTCF